MTIAGRTEIKARRSRRLVSVIQTLSLTSEGDHKLRRPSTLLTHRQEEWSGFPDNALTEASGLASATERCQVSGNGASSSSSPSRYRAHLRRHAVGRERRAFRFAGRAGLPCRPQWLGQVHPA